MELKIPVQGSSFNWTIVADEGMWYPTMDKIVYNTAVLQWNTNHKKTNNLLFSEVPTLSKENDDLIIRINLDEVGTLNVYSGEVLGLCYQRYQLEWNRRVLLPNTVYSAACEKTLNKMISGFSSDQMLELFLGTHKLSRETREELMLELCKQYVFNYGGLS